MEKKKLLYFVVLFIILGCNAYGKAIDDLIKSQDKAVKTNLPQIQEFIVHLTKNAAKVNPQVQSIINNSKANCRKDFHLDWLDDLDTRGQSSSSLSKELYILVSLSMPKSRLMALSKEAKNYNAVMVLRGLKNNSYKQTASFLQSIIQEGGAGFIIDPNLFSQYNVTQVPVFVFNDPSAKQYDQITGNISLKYALEEFAKSGDLKNAAVQVLGVQK